MTDGEATLTVLYRERKAGGDITAYDDYPDIVKVELRKWKNGKAGDTVLWSFVSVDDETAVDNRKVLVAAHGVQMADSDAIRLAIKTFDELLASHPNKDKMQ